MRNNILNELGDSLAKYGNPHMTNFDKDKWQWNDTKRINEQEKRITQLIEESNEHKKAIISLSKEVEHILGKSRWIDSEFVPSDDCKTIHVPSCPRYWIKEDYHDK
jgi:hypothetical protein